MKNKKYNLCYNLIKIILLFLLSSLFLLLSYQYLTSTFIPHYNYCYDYFHNDSFMNNFVDGSDPLKNIDCDDTQYRTGWYQFCNSSCREKVAKCISELPLNERKFMGSCSWMVTAMIFSGILFLITISGFSLFWFISEINKVKKNKNPAHKTPSMKKGKKVKRDLDDKTCT